MPEPTNVCARPVPSACSYVLQLTQTSQGFFRASEKSLTMLTADRDQHGSARGSAGEKRQEMDSKYKCMDNHSVSLQVSVVGLATVIIARDINACEQAPLSCSVILWLSPFCL